MLCSKCGAENPEGENFCGDCGAALENRCAQCGANNPTGKRFCGDCGAALPAASTPTQSPSPAQPTAEVHAPSPLSGATTSPDGERRHLTVLFSDLVGSTEIAAHLDAEDWREIAAQYQRTAAAAVARFGGHVAKYLGDGLMVYFGRNQHQALDALWVGIMRKKVSWILDADIRDFFGSLSHEWLVKFIEHRVADRRVLRLIRKWLRAGVSEEGEWSRTEVGVPQGSVVSPLLSNIFLHYGAADSGCLSCW